MIAALTVGDRAACRVMPPPIVKSADQHKGVDDGYVQDRDARQPYARQMDVSASRHAAETFG
jgi:hypothetical protein